MDGNLETLVRSRAEGASITYVIESLRQKDRNDCSFTFKTKFFCRMLLWSILLFVFDVSYGSNLRSAAAACRDGAVP